MPTEAVQPNTAQQPTRPTAAVENNPLPQVRQLTPEEMLQQERIDMINGEKVKLDASDPYSLAMQTNKYLKESKKYAERGGLEDAQIYKGLAEYANKRREDLSGLISSTDKTAKSSGDFSPFGWMGNKLKKLWRTITPQGKNKWLWGFGAAVGAMESATFTLLFGPAGGWVKAGVNALALNTFAWNKELFDKKGKATKMGSFVSGLAGSSLMYAGYKMFTEPVIPEGSTIKVQDIYNQDAVNFRNTVLGNVANTRKFVTEDLFPSVQKNVNDFWRTVTTGQLPADYVAPVSNAGASVVSVAGHAAEAVGGVSGNGFQEVVLRPGQFVEPTLLNMGWAKSRLQEAFIKTLNLNSGIFTDNRFNPLTYPDSAGVAAGILNGTKEATYPNLYRALGSVYPGEVIKFPTP